MTNFIKITKALSDPTRVRILGLLLEGEVCVCNIVAVAGVAQPTVSRHLKQCTDAGLTLARKAGGWTHYRLATDSAAPFVATFLLLLKQAVETDNEFKILRSKLHAVKKVKKLV